MAGPAFEQSSPIGRLLVMLDEVIDRVMDGGSEKDKGEALGVARATAAMMGYMDLDTVREYAMYRWEARQADEDWLGHLEWSGLR